MSLEQQLTESSQSTLMLTKSVDLLAAILGDVIGSVDALTAALKANGISIPAGTNIDTLPQGTVKQEAKDNKSNKPEVKKEETKPAPFEKEDFTKRMGEIVELVNANNGDGRAAAQAVLALTGSDKVGMTLAMDAETQAKAINNLDDALKLLKAGDETIQVSGEVMELLTGMLKDETTEEADDFGDDAGQTEDTDSGDLPDYYDDDTKIDITQVQLAMRAHAGKFGKDSAISILKAGGSASGAAKDLPELRRKSVVDMLMKGC
ncbi:hypothetical protein AMA2_42 [Achromobacter phage AMA2]|nr:hypothetical protein AMA2_42 [Achromobacter phage AMA2]